MIKMVKQKCLNNYLKKFKIKMTKYKSKIFKFIYLYNKINN